LGTGSLCTQAETEAEVANDEFVDDVADLEPIDEEE
jgi:hypothetical protein